ncbi:hypothetical protein PISMIDRAFT_17129 [Pisolithus microcarpus 441]|uniref:Uncharacterized protein n=1 Tax=Pisolithus microcarpus 441 TaxID=765257 RepID=A0A0C9Z3R5_9AGAM|nr:hypothetical protein BKA83DRAFT_17129 [Pisolithus microcarpus]KIK14688.1 hypothetical protein PISMIDRAFT_17129 [Pisolithus microcarpus 441]
MCQVKLEVSQNSDQRPSYHQPALVRALDMPPRARHHRNVPPDANGSSTQETILPQNTAADPIARTQRQRRPPPQYRDGDREYIDFGGIDLEDDPSEEEPPPKRCIPSQHTQFPAVPSRNFLATSANQTFPPQLSSAPRTFEK